MKHGVPLPGHLLAIYLSSKADTAEVRAQLELAAQGAEAAEQKALLNTAAQLEAIETALSEVLIAQAELEVQSKTDNV